jgi:hypothetical protein
MTLVYKETLKGNKEIVEPIFEGQIPISSNNSKVVNTLLTQNQAYIVTLGTVNETIYSNTVLIIRHNYLTIPLSNPSPLH